MRFLPFSSKNCKIQQCLVVFFHTDTIYAIKIAMWDCIWYDVVIFCVSEFQKNGRICGFHWTFKSKVFQLQGAKLPWPPHQGLCPWTPLGAPPPDPRYRLVLCQILNTPLMVDCGRLRLMSSNCQTLNPHLRQMQGSWWYLLYKLRYSPFCLKLCCHRNKVRRSG